MIAYLAGIVSGMEKAADENQQEGPYSGDPMHERKMEFPEDKRRERMRLKRKLKKTALVEDISYPTREEESRVFADLGHMGINNPTPQRFNRALNKLRGWTGKSKKERSNLWAQHVERRFEEEERKLTKNGAGNKMPPMPGEREAFNRRFPNAGVSLARDKDGLFVYTHRCRSPGYPSVEAMSAKRVKFVESTG